MKAQGQGPRVTRRRVDGQDGLLDGIDIAGTVLAKLRHRTDYKLGTRIRLGTWLRVLLGLLLLLSIALPLSGREKDRVQYGAGLVVNVPMPEAEVTQAVEDVAQNGIIRGTKEYAKDEYVSGAKIATSCRAFPPWTEGGKVFYKVRTQALDPQNFKDSGDTGTLAVRFVVQSEGKTNTVLRIDAVFVEDFRHATRQSNGSVESAEYKDIHDHLDAAESIKQEAAEAVRQDREQISRNQPLGGRNDPKPGTQNPVQPEPIAVPVPVLPDASSPTNPGPAPAVAESNEDLQKRVADLRRQVERLVKSPGTALKSAPFRTASTLKALTTGTEVLIVISTPYWYGVETHDGEHGWVPRDQVEPLP